MILAWLPPTASASPDRWGIDVTLVPTQMKAGQSVDFTLTLANSGDLTVTVCRIDVTYRWDTEPTNVFKGSQNIPPGGNHSWTTQEAIPPRLTPGTYSVTINVTAMTLIEPLCTSNDWILPIDVVPNVLPTAAFSFEPTTPSPKTIVYFTDASTDSDGIIVAWHWDFGDGTNSSERDPIHRFENAGDYSVVLVVRDNDDGSDAHSQTVEVLSNLPPVAGFRYAPPVANASMSVQFSDGSSDPDGIIVRWHWEFGDGSSSGERNPAHRFPSAGIYPVVLTVTDNEGASNSVTQTVVIAPPSVPNLPKSSGFGIPEWGLIAAILASTSVVAALLLKRKVRPIRRWGQTQNSRSSGESKKRWRPR